MTTATTTKQRMIFAIILLGLTCFLTLLLPAGRALALETAPYTPGENYYIDDEEAFRSQDIEHDEATENAASTSYYLTSSFYLNWISPDITVSEGEEAYIGCGAVGLEDIRYEWFVSADGGESFEPTGLVGNEHYLNDLVANEGERPYLYRCVVTNGDQTSQLEADVWVTVLDVPDPEPRGGGSQLGKLGDETMYLAHICLGAAFLVCAVAIPLLMRRAGKNQERKEV